MNTIQQQAAMMNALKIINEKWSIAVIHQVSMGKNCFNQISDALPNLSPTLISNRLKSLIRQHIVEKVSKRSGTGSHYLLTALGEQFLPVIWTLCDWGISAQQNNMSDNEQQMNECLSQHLMNLNPNLLPKESFVLQVHIWDLPRYRDWYLVYQNGELSVVMQQPSQEVNCYLKVGCKTLNNILKGKLSTQAAKLKQELIIRGDSQACSDFHVWFNSHKTSDKSFKNGISRKSVTQTRCRRNSINGSIASISI